MTTLLLRFRNRHFFVLDLVALAIIPSLALALRLDGFGELPRYAGPLLVFTLISLVVRMLVFQRAGLYARYWHSASVDETALIVLTVVVATAINTAVFFVSGFLPLSPQLPRSIPLIDGMLTLITVGGGRFSVRLSEHWRRRGKPGGKRVLIIGAGDAGRMIAREMQNNPQLGLEPVGFIDDDPAKRGMRIQGLPVLGDRERLSELVRDYRPSQAVIAMPTAPGKTIRYFLELCNKAGIEAKTIPGIYELLSGRIRVSQIRNVDIEDLLRREAVKIEADVVAQMIRGKRVLVSGAGGSIGAEICRQAAQHGPAELILLGHGENSIFQITRDLRQPANPKSAILIHPIIADIRDRSRLEAIFHHHRPHIVFHAAAHKHVPLMECNVQEAVSNNVLGTKCLIEVAEVTGVERFVLISTDKAVNPWSVMGATKRVAELLLEAAAARNGRVFVAVRFGNVLGSRGSVVPIFREQIARGGPVTVTHPEMRRYFMTIPEAVQLVMQAAAIGQGGEIFVLDMGKPVRIMDLTRDLIELSGLEVGRDIDIEVVGVRPGEKLFEELFAAGEEYHRTQHEKIFVVRNGCLDIGSVPDERKSETRNLKSEIEVDALIAAAERGEPDEVRRLLKVLVPEYQPATEG